MKILQYQLLTLFSNVVRLNHLAAIFLISVSMISSAAPPLVMLSDTPLFIGSGNVHPNLLLDLSVEFPTVKAAYNNATDYNRNIEYLGYFNSKKCYQNGGLKSFTLVNNSGLNVSDSNGKSTKLASWSDMQNGYFYAIKDADSHFECGGSAFSGNFMNWVSASSIDMLRLSLTGGDRIVDTSSQTILQRAFLPGNFYNSNYFIRKYIAASLTVSAPEMVTPYKVAKLYVLNCENKIFFSDVDTINSCISSRTYPTNNSSYDAKLLNVTDRLLGEFLVRVQVCDSSESVSRVELCSHYPSGVYKPIGNMQRNQNSVRYGAFGYLMDNANTRYGGVLRAPLKYVGENQYRSLSGFSAEPNDRPEWDPLTGIFYTNPENDVSGNSGVVNYLNKFGRSGNYKTFDPLSELYFESIRYLQGNLATSTSTSGMTIAMKDDFQVVSKWTDPIEAACQRNYIIAIGDSNTHEDTYIPGSTLNGANRPKRPADIAISDGKGNPKFPAFDVKVQTDLVAAMESGSAFGNSSPIPSLANMSSSYTGSIDGTFFLAGIAYWANTNDIRLDNPVRVKTFTIDVDENGNGSMDNISRLNTAPRLSQLYLAAKYGGFNDRNGDKNPFKTTASDGKVVVNSNTEWASINQIDPDNFFLASNPRKMMDAINRIFQSVISSGGTLAGVGISSTAASDNPYIYEPGFSSERWSGYLFKKSATNIGSDSIWNAGQILSGDATTRLSPFPTPEKRNIYTSKINADGTLKTVPFIWMGGANFSVEDQVTFNINPQNGVADNLAAERINYLRGDRSMENVLNGNLTSPGKFRMRDSILGDIINSTPTYYGAPAKNHSTNGYSIFYSENVGRKKAIYVGSNDGFLHAFDADNGTELFAYTPNALIPKLPALTDPYYTHQSYVDGKMTIRDTLVNGTWKTVLVSGMGGGSKGIFALDVTDPADFSSGAGALWEFTDKTDIDMGNIVSSPLIAKFRIGGSASNPLYGTFVIVSSGYNNYDPKSNGNSNGQGAIFLVSLDKLPNEPWVLNVNYFKYKTPIKDVTQANGLGAPNVTLGGNGEVSNVYVGDLQGNLWRFSFFEGNFPNLPHSPTLIFTARAANGKTQPITVQPQIVFAPGGGFILLFGTGKYLEASDVIPANYVPNSYYAILDTTYNADVVTGRSQLAQRIATASGKAYIISGKVFTYGATSNSSKGWYLDFPNSQLTGERIHHSLPGSIAGTTYSFNTMLLNGESCSMGSGRKYTFDVLSGLSAIETGEMSTVGLISAPTLINSSTSVSERNATGARRITTKYLQRNQGPTGTELISMPDVVTRAGRLSWVEIQNYQELRKAALTTKK